MEKSEDVQMLCPFCSTPFTKEMVEIYNEGYGCDSGCSYVRVEVVCSKCQKVVYTKGSFGEVSDEDRAEVLEEEWSLIIKKERGKIK